MANVINKDTKEIRKSVHTPDQGNDWLINPEGLLGAIEINRFYRKIDGNSVREATTEEKITIDPLILNYHKQAAVKDKMLILYDKLSVHVVDSGSVIDVPNLLSKLNTFVGDVRILQMIGEYVKWNVGGHITFFTP